MTLAETFMAAHNIDHRLFGLSLAIARLTERSVVSSNYLVRTMCEDD